MGAMFALGLVGVKGFLPSPRSVIRAISLCGSQAHQPSCNENDCDNLCKHEHDRLEDARDNKNLTSSSAAKANFLSVTRGKQPSPAANKG
jgi:hypothetical protein